MQHEGGTADEHGRKPGVPSRTGTGAEPPADAERVRRAGEDRTRVAHVRGQDGAGRPGGADEEGDWPA
ncbi:hypothetical protein AB0M92_12740 [Streptomyces sp. NPDC051582]|uniref:hypothetical protein n=1 Tax=Streptomyces sp. NPDC051582 TaxID=3155167 RepID=UPI00343A7321